MERGKPITWRTYNQRSGDKEKAEAITYLYVGEGGGTVPKKSWKHDGGIATSQLKADELQNIVSSGSSMTKRNVS